MTNPQANTSRSFVSNARFRHYGYREDDEPREFGEEAEREEDLKEEEENE